MEISNLVKIIPFEVEFNTPQECVEYYKRYHPSLPEIKAKECITPFAGLMGIVVGSKGSEYGEYLFVIIPKHLICWIPIWGVKPLGIWKG